MEGKYGGELSTAEMSLVEKEINNLEVFPPCLVCGGDLIGVVVKQEVGEEGNLEGGWTDEEKLIYLWFVKWFKLVLASPRKKFGWDVEETFPFCGGCKGELGELVGLQRRVEEWEGRIQRGVEGLRGRMNGSEGRFSGGRIYERDPRYKRVRKQIVADFKERYGGARKSGREKRTVRRYDPSSVDPHGATPVVLLSTSDKTNAEEHLIKQEESELIDLEETFGGDDDYDGGIAQEATVETPSNDKGGRRSGRKRKSRLPPKILVECDEDDEIPPNFEDDYLSPPASPPNPPSPPPVGKRRKPKPSKPLLRGKSRGRKLAPPPPPKSKDEDWSAPDISITDPDSSDEDLLEEPEKRTHFRLILDPSKNTLQYDNLTFHKMEGDSSTEDNLYQCSSCLAVIKHRGSNIRCHYLSRHSDIFHCRRPRCSHRAKNRSSLISHVSIVHEGFPREHSRPIRHYPAVPCPICSKPSTASKLKAHLWSHKSAEEKSLAISSGAGDVPGTSKKRHQCDECGLKFGNPSNLRRHKEHRHGSGKDSPMDLCPECGGTYACLKSHRERVHGGNIDGKPSKMYTCLEGPPTAPPCGGKFRSLAQLAKHKNAVHRKIRPHKCTFCPRTFSAPKALQNHLNIHNGVRPWTCTHCPMAFTYKSNLQRHEDLYHTPGKAPPKRKAYLRGPTMLGADTRKRELIQEGKYLPPSALATWAQGREPTSHFPLGMNKFGDDDNSN